MGVTKLDIYGSTYNRNVQDVFKSTATRVFRGKSLPDSNAANAEAVQDAIDEAGLVYQGPGIAIPLKNVRVVRDSVMGPNAVRGVLEYGFTQSDGQQQAARLIASLSGGTIGIPWYEDTEVFEPFNSPTGQPNGFVYFKDGTRQFEVDGGTQSKLNPPVPFVWVTKAYSLRVPGQGKASPYPFINSKFGLTNSDSITFGGLSFTANQLLFSALEIEEFSTAGGNTYVWNYVFTYLPAKFEKQRVYWDDAKWVLEQPPLHNSSTFSGSFPAST